MKKLLILSLLLYSLGSYADITKLIKNAGGTEEYPNAGYIVIFDSTMVDVKESGLSYNTMHTLYKVLTPAGAKELNHLVFGYDPRSAFIKIREVKIYRKSGNMEILGPEKIYDYPAPARAIYWGARQKMAATGRLEPGDAIEVKYFKKGFTYALLLDESDDSKYIPPMKGHYYDIIQYWFSEPVLEKTYITHVPNSKTLTYKFFHGKAITSIDDLGEKTRYSFTKKNIMPIEREPGMVALSDVAPKLLVTTSPDWEAKSLWFYGVNEDFGSFETTPAINKKVNEILEGATSEMDSISKLNHWVADTIRYSGISMGEGEGYTLHKGDMTFTDRCGVCKDKAGMLITMLRAAGFESYPAMTMAGSRIEDIPADQFNHSVTIVKMSDGNYKLLDPTWVPFCREEWSSRDQQPNSLMGIPEGADLMITPVSDPENHLLLITAETELLENGTLEGTIVVESEGQSDASLRGLFTRNFKTEWESSFEQELRRIAENIEILDSSYSNPYGHMVEPMKYYVKFRIPNYALVTEEEILITPVSAGEIFKRAQAHLHANTKLKERRYGFRDQCSRLVKIKETLTLPVCDKIIYQPEVKNIDGTAASFSGNYTLENNTLSLSENIRIKKRLFEADEWENYKAAVEAQKKFASEKVIISR